MRLLTPFVCLLVLASCETRDEPYQRASKVEVGMLEAKALAIAGTPSRTIQPAQICGDPSAVRAHYYDDVTRLLWLKEVTHRSIELCVDARDVVIVKRSVKY